MDKKLVALLNKQVNMEFFSAYLYFDIHAYYKDQNLDGFANWYKIQAQEERDHALMFVEYLQANGERPVLDAIAAPKTKFKDFSEPLELAFKHEQTITASINEIYALAYEKKDFRTMQFLDFFVKEQGEEEQNAESLVKRFELFGKDSRGLYLLDAELGERDYSADSADE